MLPAVAAGCRDVLFPGSLQAARAMLYAREQNIPAQRYL